ncbi:hypothetical protein [Tomitella cavernea]|uniref:Low molecular weight antigen MTB12-like C-terminal domain-containing protein n=1 Tax=Tomitella cavernea TaxID=1387982 RepID=A0ABP9D1B9_9ACTN|nr:hypothetical protein [Tomitella cavernea]
MLTKPRRPIAVIAVSAACAFTLSACGASEPAATPTTTAGGTTIDDAGNALPAPTAAELQAQFATIIDPAVPAEQKAVLVEGGEDDPAAFDVLAQKLAASPNATMTLSEPVTATGDATVSVPFTATFDGQQSQGDATFVAEDGIWKLSHENACAVLRLMAITSAACPEA